MNAKTLIAKRVAKEFHDGDYVNLGIGIPTLVTNYLPKNVQVMLHSENGFLGIGPTPEKAVEDMNIVNANGIPVTIVPGGAIFDSAMSFAIIRGGHLSATVLGALEVDVAGNIANWLIPGKKVHGMGGAMDLVVGAKRVIVAMEHTSKGQYKILPECTLPLTGTKVVNLIVTELCVMEVVSDGLLLTELAPDVTLEDVKLVTPAPFAVSPNLHYMQID